MNPFLIEDELKMKSHIFHISIQVFLNFLSLFFYFVPNISPIASINVLGSAKYDNEADLKMQAQNRINL